MYGIEYPNNNSEYFPKTKSNKSKTGISGYSFSLFHFFSKIKIISKTYKIELKYQRCPPNGDSLNSKKFSIDFTLNTSLIYVVIESPLVTTFITDQKKY